MRVAVPAVAGMDIAAVAAPDCYSCYQQMMSMFADFVRQAIAEEEVVVGAVAAVVAIYSWLACDVLALAPWHPKPSFQPDTSAFHDQFYLPNPVRRN